MIILLIKLTIRVSNEVKTTNDLIARTKGSAEEWVGVVNARVDTTEVSRLNNPLNGISLTFLS